MELYPYTPHQTPEENRSVKYHITAYGEVAICGFSHSSYGTSFGMEQIDKIWLDQPDPYTWVCKKCRKLAEQILNNPWLGKWIVLPKKKTVDELQLFFIQADKIANAEDGAWDKFLGGCLKKEAYEKDGFRAVQIDKKITNLLKKAFDEE